MIRQSKITHLTFPRGAAPARQAERKSFPAAAASQQTAGSSRRGGAVRTVKATTIPRVRGPSHAPGPQSCQSLRDAPGPSPAVVDAVARPTRRPRRGRPRRWRCLLEQLSWSLQASRHGRNYFIRKPARQAQAPARVPSPYKPGGSVRAACTSRPHGTTRSRSPPLLGAGWHAGSVAGCGWRLARGARARALLPRPAHRTARVASGFLPAGRSGRIGVRSCPPLFYHYRPAPNRFYRFCCQFTSRQSPA
jgi:hypothetical protein